MFCIPLKLLMLVRETFIKKFILSHTKLHRHHETNLQEYTEKDNLVLIDA